MMTTGWNKKLYRLIFRYPAICLLPVFTHFSFAPRKLSCCKQRETETKHGHLILSKKATAINAAISLVFYITTLALLFDLSEVFRRIYPLFVVVLGILFTVLFLILDTSCYQNSCCPSSGLQYHYINTNPDNENEIEVELREPNEPSQYANMNEREEA